MFNFNSDSASLGLTSEQKNSTANLPQEILASQQGLFPESVPTFGQHSSSLIGGTPGEDILDGGTNQNWLAGTGNDIPSDGSDLMTGREATDGFWINSWDSLNTPTTTTNSNTNPPQTVDNPSLEETPNFNFPDIGQFFSDFISSTMRNTSLEEFLALMGGETTSADSQSSSVSSYSNTGDITASLMEKQATGKPSAEVIQEATIAPSGLEDKYFGIPEKISGNHIPGYTYRFDTSGN